MVELMFNDIDLPFELQNNILS